MSDVVERQDVDINKLFGWGRVFEVVDPKDESVVLLIYMKLLGDADLGRSRVYALRKSSELRRKLKDENSDERLAWVRSIDEVTEEDLINLIVVYSMRELSNNARSKVNIPAPKAPKSNAKLEQVEEFQKQVDEYPKKRQEALKKAIEEEVKNLMESCKLKSKEELHKKYVRLLIDEFCEREAITAFEDMQTFLGCYTDDSYSPDKRFFKTFEEFDNLEPTLKGQFKDAYRSLDIELSELKKLRRATP